MKTKAFSLVIVLFLLTAGSSLSHAVVTTNITASPLPPCPAPCGTGITSVNQVSPTEYRITGGARPGGGIILYHSFGNFSVGGGDTANFFNDTGLATSDILGRVTGGNPSNIFGSVQTTGFGSANLFLINPAGIVFGPNATLDIGRSIGTPGSFHVSTADYIRFNDPSQLDVNKPRFYADPTQSSILTSFSPDAFGFLNPNPAAIAIQGSTLQVGERQTISVVGGNRAFMTDTGDTVPPGVTMTGGTLSAPSGRINVASVASTGEVLFPGLQYGPNVNGDVFTSKGTINLSAGATLDVSSGAAGTVVIRGGQLVIADATISADTINTNGAPVAIDINVTGDLSITDTRGTPAITARTTGAGNAGEFYATSANLNATTSVPAETFHALIDTHNSGTGAAGSVTIATGNLTVAGPAGTFFFIDSGPQAVGAGGNVTITAQGHIELTGTTISTGAQLAGILGLEAGGPGGNLTLTADSLRASDAHFLTAALSSVAETERGGDLTMNVRDITMLPNTSVSAGGTFGGGAITINADRLFTDATSFDTFTFFGPGKGITFNGRILELTNGSTWSTSVFGDFNAGDIRVTATDHVSLIGITGTNALGEVNPSGFFSNSLGFFGTQGGSGNIFVTTPRLTMMQGRMNTSTATSGRGGNVTVNADMVVMSGEFPSRTSGDFFFNIGDIHPSGIFTQTVGSDFCAGPCGKAGNITANIGSLAMGLGSQLNSGTSNTGQAGTITINATNTIAMSGTLSDGSPVGVFSRTIGTDPGSGNGGNIELHGTQVEVMNRASVSASSTGLGNAGNIMISASDSLVMQNHGSITTATTQSDGGDIHVQAGRMVQLTASQITTSVQGGLGNGGNITIDPQFVILQGSQVLAQAFGGNGGNIRIVAGVFLMDATSTVSASSTFGRSGTVQTQTTVSNLSESVAPLPAEIVQAAQLLQARCAARLAGGTSGSFVVAGRDGLPLEPGGLLPSPLYVESERSTRLAESLGLPALQIGLPFVESSLVLGPLALGCSS